MRDIAYKRTYPVGAEFIPNKGTAFRIWAPHSRQVDLVLENVREKPCFCRMKKEKEGYFSFFSNEAIEGTLYRFRISSAGQWLPDPASRYQPLGPSGPSCVVSSHYPWKHKWKGVDPFGHIVYELHIGTFTKQGTFLEATKELIRLAGLGITLIEIMPINEFPGHFGWGYDGVNLFAPFHLYGTPQEVKAFIDTAHGLNMGVVLDVVYNHLGPKENTLIQFSHEYLHATRASFWGQTVNFDNPHVREFFLTNAAYWVQEFQFDGLRIDATQWFFSSTKEHILAELTHTVKKAGGKRKTIVIGENDSQDTKLLRPRNRGGYGFDMLWNDDFHHTALVRLTGKREGYYTDYLGTPQEFISSLKYGFLYQGQYYLWKKHHRGTPDLQLPYHSLMIFLENHDQVANSGYGLRLHKKSDPGNYKAMTALLLLSPNTPLIFQGQEYHSNQSFYYFADHAADLAPLIRKGRKKELAQFPRLATKEMSKLLPDPDDPKTFIECKLNKKELTKPNSFYQLFKDLISLRKNDPVFKNMHNSKIDGAVLGNDSFLIRYFGKEEDRVLLINFGPDYHFSPSPEPLLVAGLNKTFEVLWSSEATVYGGEGTPPINNPSWKIPGHSAIVLKTVSLRVQT